MQLAVIGGKMTKDEDIVFEGRKFVFPTQFRGDLTGLKRFIDRYIEGQSEEILVEKTFNYRPMDGAHAVYHCLKEYFGYAQSKARQGIFGKQPPQEITVATGYVDGKLQTITVPWGDMVLPGLTSATLTITMKNTPQGQLLHLIGRVRRVEKEPIDGFFKVVEEYLAENSIYRGWAVYGNMEFIDHDKIDPTQFVYSEDVWRDAQTHIFSPMKDSAVLEELGLERKRVLLLEGPYGTGKSGLGRTAAKVAVSNGWTAIIARPGIDDPFDVLRTARLYQPSMVFIEDIDNIASSMDSDYVTKLLDTFDGFGTKDLQMLLIVTTNHADRIHKGMLRPGRIHGTISIGAMDRQGVEKLCNIVIGDALEDDIDFDAVFEATEGYMPAYVREGLERAVRYTVARLSKKGPINTEDLVAALKSLRAQLALQDAANDRHEKLPMLDRVFRQMLADEVFPPMAAMGQAVEEKLEERVESAAILKPNGDRLGNIKLNDD